RESESDADVDHAELAVRNRAETEEKQDRGHGEEEREVAQKKAFALRIIEINRDRGGQQRREDQRERQPPRDEAPRNVVDVREPRLRKSAERKQECETIRYDKREQLPANHRTRVQLSTAAVTLLV